MNKISLPEQVRKLIQTLNDHGYEAYAVGGCVRDVLLGKVPDDWDVTTSAKPEEVKALFRKTIDTGIEHGTVTVLLEGGSYEVTTYREDGEYVDGRHPKEVQFVPNLEEDLKRRDFTINAMAYNDKDGIIDLYGGVEDLEEGCIRCVGCAEDRFREDALRMMRAVRFAGQTGFFIEEETIRAIAKLHANIRKVSAERIQVELVKLLCSDYPQFWEMGCDQGLCMEVLPEFDAIMKRRIGEDLREGTYGQKALHVAALLPSDKVLRLATLFIYMEEETGEIRRRRTEQALKKLKFDNDTIRKVSLLAEYFTRRTHCDETAVRHGLHDMGEELFYANLLLQWGDASCIPGRVEEELTRISKVWEMAEHIQERGDCISLKELRITGRDLMELGAPQGKQIGEILQVLLEKVLENPSLNTREQLAKLARGLLTKGNE